MAVAAAVVAAEAARGAEHHRIPCEVVHTGQGLPQRQPGQAQQVARDGVQDGEAAGRGVLPEGVVGDEDATMTGVERFHESVAGVAGPERGGGREQEPRGRCCRAVAKVSQQRGPPVVVLAEAAAEAAVREDAAPAFADQGGVHQARGVLRWETQEEFFDEIVRRQS